MKSHKTHRRSCPCETTCLCKGRDPRPPAAILSFKQVTIATHPLDPRHAVPPAQSVRELFEAIESTTTLSTSLDVSHVRHVSDTLGPSRGAFDFINIDVHVYDHQSCYPAMNMRSTLLTLASENSNKDTSVNWRRNQGGKHIWM